MIKKITTIAGTGVLAVFAFAGSASAAVDCQLSDVKATNPACSVEVKPVTLEPVVRSTAPAVRAPASNKTTQLPVTGGDATALALAGSAMLAGGVVLVSKSRQAEVTN